MKFIYGYTNSRQLISNGKIQQREVKRMSTATQRDRASPCWDTILTELLNWPATCKCSQWAHHVQHTSAMRKNEQRSCRKYGCRQCGNTVFTTRVTNVSEFSKVSCALDIPSPSLDIIYIICALFYISSDSCTTLENISWAPTKQVFA